MRPKRRSRIMVTWLFDESRLALSHALLCEVLFHSPFCSFGMDLVACRYMCVNTLSICLASLRVEGVHKCAPWVKLEIARESANTTQSAIGAMVFATTYLESAPLAGRAVFVRLLISGLLLASCVLMLPKCV